MSEENVPKDILDKARKLWNLRENAGTEGEALAAAKALAKLVDKHRLEIATIEGLGAATSEVMAFDEDEPLISYKRKTTWRYELGAILCEHYGVMFILRTNQVTKKRRVLMAGRKTDIEMVRYMFNWLSPQVELLAMQSEAKGRTAIGSWKLGFVWGIHDQLKEARKEAVAGNPTGAMVLRCRHQEAKNWLKEQKGKDLPQIKESAATVDPVWFKAGEEKGKVHHLGKSLAGGD